MQGSQGPFKTIAGRFQTKLPYQSSETSRYWFSPSIPTGGVVCLTGSASVTSGETVGVVASVKPVLGLLGSLPNGGITLLNKLVWGPWFIALGSTPLNPIDDPSW